MNQSADVLYIGGLPPYEIAGKEYPVTGVAKTDKFGKIPLVDIPMMSDLKWHKNCLKSRLENPEPYRSMGEDVEAAIERLRRTIAEMEAAGIEWGKPKKSTESCSVA